ncbi:hypothetical protein B0J11DRAFT_154719 [Dendryphion nanum]|uniref:NADH dehydrogenase [ubiquinone] 1 alpha subcomplex subunit n=1 Tax=Dendryphion nanum TaxID=256645 RepID=A0A9P9IVL6_9PLEO|nr:hypothetical protein B0J11DRAFT_154719 [Dendryphion nanum]
MTTNPPGTIRRLWLNWKMMRLPWRKRWLVGYDLEGNTFWEFQDALNSNRFRRIVEYSRSTYHSDVNVPPQWMQWLRHTRAEPPSLAEQRADVFRQEQMKVLAAAADARWAAKPSALDAPNKQQPIQMLESRNPDSGIRQMNIDQETRDRAQPSRVPEKEGSGKETPSHSKPTTREPKDSPWNQSTTGKVGNEWQPQSWAPAPPTNRGA